MRATDYDFLKGGQSFINCIDVKIISVSEISENFRVEGEISNETKEDILKVVMRINDIDEKTKEGIKSGFAKTF
jgi:hypothetical protein